MDRLPAVAVAALAIAASSCGDDRSQGAAPRERVNAVAARPEDQATPAEMCDVVHPGADAPAFAWPGLTAPAPQSPAGAWTWINVWATWCKPCVEELPKLGTWRARLEDRGANVALHFVSADASDDEVREFRATHPNTPASMRLADPDALPGWMERLGVPGASLPLHVFVDPDGRVRCVRASAVEEDDYPAIEALVTRSRGRPRP